MGLSKVKKLFATVALLCSATLGFALDLPANKLVDTKWLNENIDDENLVIIDIREKGDLYKQAHIPKAIYWSVNDIREVRNNIPGYVASPTDVSRLFEKSGITKDSAVVFYYEGDEAPSYTIATLGLYIAEYYGLKNTAILNGGYAAWVKDGFSTTQDVIKPAKGKFDIEINSELVATVPDMDRAVETSNVNLLDGRNKDQFSGVSAHPKAKKSGHLPNAINIFIADLVKNVDGVFYINDDKASVEKIFTAAKVDNSKNSIWYCNTGWFASGGWFVGKYILGHQNDKVYDASMVEYSTLPKRKVVK